MKFGTKKSVDAGVGAKPAKKKAPSKAKAKAPADVKKARATLTAMAGREAATISADTAVLLALSDVTSLVTVSEAGGRLVPNPFGTRSMFFDDNAIGIDDGQLPLVLGRASTAINDARVDALITKNLLSPPSAHLVIGDVIDIIQLWIDNPSLTA